MAAMRSAAIYRERGKVNHDETYKIFPNLILKPLKPRKVPRMLLPSNLCSKQQRPRFTLINAVLQRFAAP